MSNTFSIQRLRPLARLLVFRMLAMYKRHPVGDNWPTVQARSWQVIEKELDKCAACGKCKIGGTQK